MLSTAQKTFVVHGDCDSFFAECERVFRPDLRGVPVVVLSNNDGCVVSRTKEAKAIGIKMGDPYFKIERLLQTNKGVAFSSNFRLYGNLSSRVMRIFIEYFPLTEVYSIDEVFSFFSGVTLQELFNLCLRIRDRILKEVGLPVSIGIADSKVNAKIATDFAKKSSKGVYAIEDDFHRSVIHKNYPIFEIWGIGKASTEKLNKHGIRTAFELANADHELIQSELTIVGRRIQDELKGIRCLDIELIRPKKKQIITSRTMPHAEIEIEILNRFLCDHILRATEKIRDEGLVAHAMSIFIHTNYFSDNPKYYGQKNVIFHQGQNAPNVMMKAGISLLEKIYKYGFLYNKVGVILMDLRPVNERQLSLVDTDYEKNERLARVLDLVNKKQGSGVLKLMSCHMDRTPTGNMKSPDYMTDLKQVLKIRI